MDGMNVYLKSSLNPENDKNVLNIFKAGEGMGKSGSFFFFSHDDRFLIKTMTNDDFNAFMKFFKYYFEHVNEFPNSLIARIYGVYQIEIEGMVPVYLLLMGNSKKIDNSYIQKIYDLKGSLIIHTRKYFFDYISSNIYLPQKIFTHFLSILVLRISKSHQS